MATSGFNEIRTNDNISMDKNNSTVSSTILPWDRFSNWVYCVCSVTFDLELGQAMEMIYPAHVKLTEREKLNVCYLSFPDSNSGCMGDTQFHFRIRQCPGKKCHFPAQFDYNKDCPASLQSDAGYWFGFVYFRQTRDPSQKRGYFQKSVVLITRLPFTQFFTHVLSIIANEFFENGELSLEAACHDVDQWPEPIPGQNVQLPLVGSVLQVCIPSRLDQMVISPLKIGDTNHAMGQEIYPSIHEIDIFSPLQTVLPYIQLLWELVLTAEPIVVMASSPSFCANAVQALVSMVWPLKYCSDYRPYFTIHDSEFKEYTTKTRLPPSVILGVTNPFFSKTLQHWPHIIRIDDNLGTSEKSLSKMKKAFNPKALDNKPGVYTEYKPFLQKDKQILKRFVKGVETKRPLEVQNTILKRYLMELTQSFMIPLERYAASLMPFLKNISPYKSVPTLKPFVLNDMLASVERSGPQLTSGVKGDWLGLYKKFVRTINFEGWWRYRQSEMNRKLQALHFEALADADLTSWIRNKPEVEVVDIILRLRDKLSLARRKIIPVSENSIKKVNVQLESIINSVPEDLKSVFMSNNRQR